MTDRVSAFFEIAGPCFPRLFGIIIGVTKSNNFKYFFKSTRNSVSVDTEKWLQVLRIMVLTSGFDMVMVHAAHGNLLAQFLSPKYNQRTDEYGGSFENRARWPLSVLKAMRERVGKGLCIDMRISGDELVPGGMGIEETKAFIRLAQEYIDTVHVSQGLIVEPKYMPYTMPAFYLPHCHNVKWSEQIKADPDIHIPVTVVGSITTVAEAEEIIASGKADMVAMARQLMCDNKLLYNAYRGMEEKTRPCLRCHECAPADIVHLRCATNPRLGRESEIPEELPCAKHKKRVVVVGGGVAGCMAAKTLVERGHDVILIEKHLPLKSFFVCRKQTAVLLPNQV